VIVPSGLTEQQVLTVINSIVNKLAPGFKFGYFDIEDIKQEGFGFALEALPKFNPTTGKPSKERDNICDRLYNFLRQHIRNRFLNLRRNKFERSTPPCKCCPFYNRNLPSQCAAFSDRQHCDKYEAWERRNAAKRGLNESAEIIDEQTVYVNGNDQDILHIKEFRDVINIHLSANLRPDYQRLLEGISITKVRKEKVFEAVAYIVYSGGFYDR
jgi:hypothetical protein